jgi:PAS domain S-box-containing protein
MKTELEPNSPTALGRLRGLLEVTRLVRSDVDLSTVLEETARILREALGYETVVINLYRPAWDDFWVAAVEGSDEARETLLGATYERSAWELILDPRFERRGAYSIPAGAIEWGDLGARWNPAGPASPDPGAWQPEDELFVPFRHSDGHFLGVLSLGEPTSGRRPSDDELDVLVAVAGHAASAVQSAQEASEAAQHQLALKELLRVSTSLAGRSDVLEDQLEAVCDAISSALGFQRVAIELVDRDSGFLIPRAASGWTLQAPVFQVRRRLADVQLLLDPTFEIAGCFLLPSEAASKLAPSVPTTYASENNGRGPYAWSHHWLIVPLSDASGDVIGVIWADDPVDLLLPSEARLEALRTFANQAATAIESQERDEKLRLSEEQFRRVFEESPLGMVLVDNRLRVIDVNEATARMLGYERVDTRGTGVLSATHPDDAESEREMLRQLFAGSIRQYTIEKRCIHRDGRVVWVNLTASTVGDTPGKPRMVLRILEDVTERRLVQQELEQAHAVRQSLLKRVVEAAESERTRLAAELHDGPIQRLSAMSIRLESARLAGARGDWSACSTSVASAQANLGNEIGRLRRLMTDLRPPVLDEQGLVAALGGLASQVQAASSVKVSATASPPGNPELDEDTETALYRIAQEALANVVKHAGARSAWIALSSGRREVHIEIGDDGRGFDPEATPLADGHFGLITMRERAQMAGGSLVVESESGGGTRVRVRIPRGEAGGEVA